MAVEPVGRREQHGLRPVGADADDRVRGVGRAVEVAVDVEGEVVEPYPRSMRSAFANGLRHPGPSRAPPSPPVRAASIKGTVRADVFNSIPDALKLRLRPGGVEARDYRPGIFLPVAKLFRAPARPRKSRLEFIFLDMMSRVPGAGPEKFLRKLDVRGTPEVARARNVIC